MTQDPAPVLDLDTALLHCGSKQELALRLLRKLCDLGAQDSEKILNALESQAVDDAAALGHRLKGSAAPLGAERVRRAAAAVEEACRSGGEVRSPALQLRDEVRELAREIETRFGADDRS